MNSPLKHAHQMTDRVDSAYGSEDEASRWFQLAVASLQGGADGSTAILHATTVARLHEKKLGELYARLREQAELSMSPEKSL